MTLRCCGNCEWSISPECEEEIMRENHYEEDDPTRPKAGDCCLGMDHGEDYFCHHHEYTSGGLETYTFYEAQDLGPGYYVVSTFYDHIIRFFKLYRTGSYGSFDYGIRVYEIDPVEKGKYNDILFDIEKTDNEMLYTAIKYFATALGNNVIRSSENNSYVTADINKYSVSIIFTKTNCDKDENNFIDIKIEHNVYDRNYKLIEHLFRNMAVVTSNMKDEDCHRKVRKLTKN